MDIMKIRTALIPLLVAIAALNWVLIHIFHEMVGHGGACLLLGDKTLGVTLVFLNCKSSSALLFRWILAAGGLINVLLAAVCFLALRFTKIADPALRYFLWLFAAMVVLWDGFYIAVGAGFSWGWSDWHNVTRGLEPVLLWKGGVVLFGLCVLVGGGVLLFLELESFLRGSAHRLHDFFMLVGVPVVVGIVVNLAANAFCPITSLSGALLETAPLFALLLLGLPLRIRGPRGGEGSPPWSNSRSAPWLLAGLVACLFFFAVLAPGIGDLKPVKSPIPGHRSGK